jgi:hypothetical protein
MLSATDKSFLVLFFKKELLAFPTASPDCPAPPQHAPPHLASDLENPADKTWFAPG